MKFGKPRKAAQSYTAAFVKCQALGLLVLSSFCSISGRLDAGQPNVILIMCDDLNDYVDGFGGHPQAFTPNIKRLASSGTAFTQAHCNIPICGPSRASMFTGIYPHHSGCFGFTKWNEYEILRNSRTMMDHFRAHGYRTFGTGKLMHHMVRAEWTNFGNLADYGPYAFDGKNKLAHPDVPPPYCDIGAVDGSFGPLISLQGRKTAAGVPLIWRTGSWMKQRTLHVTTQQDRDATADELNGDWAVARIRENAGKLGQQPFFLGVGFIRPHTPLIVPKRFFDKFPLDSIKLPKIRRGDVDDTFSQTVRGIPKGADGPRSADMGTRLYNALVDSYASDEQALRHFIQAYLASVASVDEQIGKILDAVDHSNLKDNTIIVLTSDHGWGMGEKNYLYKNSLWQESTRVPLVIRAPGVALAGSESPEAVSLLDIYPTLLDLCSIPSNTKKSEIGRPLDGHSLKPLLADPSSGRWRGPRSALTALYKWRTKYDPSKESYSLRSKTHRYIRYENGREEFYDTLKDPHEWTNLAGDPAYAMQLADYRSELRSRVPSSGTEIPPQPAFKPKLPQSPQVNEKSQGKRTGGNLSGGNAEAWKSQYFSKHPQADSDRDGILSWPEYKSYREKHDPPPPGR